MRALVRFLLIFTCMNLIVSKPQHLQEQIQYHLDPLNEAQFEYPSKDPGKRTIGAPHYAVGKHIGIHPLGFKYVLGYSPINLKYVPVIKPVTVFKPVLHQSIKPLWKPVLPPTRHYLPPVHHVDHGWKPVVPVVKPVVPVAPPVHHHHQKPWVDEHVHTVVQEPVVPVKPALVPVNPVHNYYYFQTPVAKPALVPQVPLFHVTRPQLPVLPLGATFPAPVLPASTGPGLLHFPHTPSVPVVPSAPVFPVQHLQPIAPAFPAHHTPVAFPAPHPPVAFPVPRPALAIPAPHPPVAVHAPHPPVPVPVAPHPPVHHPVAVPAPPPIPAPPQHPALPPISIEFHGNHNLVPLAGRQPHALSFQPEIHTNFVPQFTHLHPAGNPQVMHLHPVGNPQIPVHHPPEVQDHGPPQPPFNPEAAIQPGQTDLQVPLHLPHHPHFRQIHGFDHHNQQPDQFPPFQSPGQIVRPSISLEPPIIHGHS